MAADKQARGRVVRVLNYLPTYQLVHMVTERHPFTTHIKVKFFVTTRSFPAAPDRMRARGRHKGEFKSGF